MFTGLFFTFLGNKLMWENAAQMQIVSLNWWQYAGRVWSHANNVQPPNSHLATKLKIITTHWNNSQHISGTWYCPSDPTLVACVPASSGQKSPDTTRHMLSTRVRTIPGQTAAHAWRTALCLVQLQWRVRGGGWGWGRGIVLDVTKVTSIHPYRPW